MTAYTYFSILGTTANNTNAATLLADDILYLAQGGLLSATGDGSAAISGPLSNKAFISGDVFAKIYGIHFGSDSTVTVNSMGAVSSGLYGTVFDGENDKLVNAGTISGYVAVRMSGGNGNIQNSGTISSDGYAVIMQGTEAQTNLLVNSGTIESTYKALNMSVGADTVINKGVISGMVGLSDGDDLYAGVQGWIHGIVDLGYGNDSFAGGTGNEVIDGGVGDDDIDGGGGIDTFIYSAGGAIVVDLGAGTAFNLVDHDTLENMENATTSEGNDRIAGSTAANTLVAGFGADGLFGLDGNDRLFGQQGTDTLTGGNGRDIMAGGTEADVFDFNALAESKVGIAADIIRDFVHLTDKIELSTIDAKSVAAGNQAFSFLPVQGAAFTGVAGQLHYVFSQGFTYVEGDVNGDKAADFRIALVGFIPLTSGDFAL